MVNRMVWAFRRTFWRFKSAYWAFTQGYDIKEFVKGEYHKIEDCPSYYDGCNCYGTLWKENEFLVEKLRNLGPNDIMKNNV